MAKMVEKEKIKDIIDTKNWLWNYKWEWDNTKEPYNMPILVLPPTLGRTIGEPSTFLRVYAYGGRLYDIRVIETETSSDDNKMFQFDKKYLRYAHPSFRYGKDKQQKPRIPEDFKKKYELIYNNYGNADDLKKLLLNVKSFEDIIVDKTIDKENKLLDFIILGARNNNTKKNEIKKERWVQTEIVKKYISKKYLKNSKEEQYLIFDMEYNIELGSEGEGRKITKRDSENPNIINETGEFSKNTEIDLILFDGKKFGFVELKYNGESMRNGTKNDLREHYLDFYEAKKKMDGIQRELLRRLWFLFRYQIIDKSWEEAFYKIGIRKEIWGMSYDEMKKAITDLTNSQCFDYWYGFLFWNDEFFHGNKGTILKKFEKQVKPEFEDYNMPLKYCYYDDKSEDNNIKFIVTGW